MSWRVIEEGDSPSLPLGLLKSALRIHHDADDLLLRHLTQVAKQYIETYTQSLLGNVRLEIIVDLPSTDILTLPIGPLRTIESVSIRKNRREWIDVCLEQVKLLGHRVRILTKLDADQICIIGLGGINPIPSIIEGIWLNLVRILYESETPDMSAVKALLKPLASIKRCVFA
jgi:uncharacterized phiE125 gp8 family phage protein